MESGGLAPLWAPPPPAGECLLLLLLCYPVGCKGPDSLVPGEEGQLSGSGRGQGGTVTCSSPGMWGAWDGVGQGIEGRLSPRPQAVDEHSGHQGPLQLGMGCRRSPVHAAVHGGGGRRGGSTVHAAQQAWVVEIRRRKHPLQCRVIPCLGQQLQAHCSLPLPLGPEIKAGVRAPCSCGHCPGTKARSPPLTCLLFLGEHRKT